MKESRFSVNVLLVAIWLLCGSFLLIFLPKGELALWFNERNSLPLDNFFKYITWLGDGALFAVLGILFLFIRFYYFLLLVLSALLQTILVQGLKRFVFDGLSRPRIFLELDGMPGIHYVDGVTVHGYHTFPSGHAATAFAAFMLLALIYRNKWWTVLAFLIAAAAAISRVYLLQHFFIDVYFGSIIGMASVAAVYFHFEVRLPELQDKPLWARPLIRLR